MHEACSLRHPQVDDQPKPPDLTNLNVKRYRMPWLPPCGSGSVGMRYSTHAGNDWMVPTYENRLRPSLNVYV